ncbi:hypothetical protein Goari_012169 [Gossypium aridum]|uniref:Calcineurin B-like protein n=1 Tax=Gossypium aridum TaxID=34290 RepID=A0A7J8WZN1_GOSAI|nr:hypothetical protein [Gossypium aridum]
MNKKKENIFANRIFDLFDAKKKGVIDFGDFVRALNIFHPNASQEDKTDFAFKLYDMDGTGFIERNEVKLMLIALLCESEMKLGDEIIEAILDKVRTFVVKQNILVVLADMNICSLTLLVELYLM